MLLALSSCLIRTVGETSDRVRRKNITVNFVRNCIFVALEGSSARRKKVKE